MKRGLKIFSVILLILIVLCSVTSAYAVDMNNMADGAGESNIDEKLEGNSFESDSGNEASSKESYVPLDDSLGDGNDENDSGSDLIDDEDSASDLMDDLDSGDSDSDLSDNEIDGGSDSDSSEVLYANDSLISDLNDPDPAPLSYVSLADTINMGLPNGRVDLFADYRFDSSSDEAYVFGISIVPTAMTTIDGHGHSIDGNFEAAIFSIYCNEADLDGGLMAITFRNLIFRNVGWSDDMRDCYERRAPPGEVDKVKSLFNAVRATGVQLIFKNCSFYSNECPVNAPISCKRKSQITVENCNFHDNAGNLGGAISIDTSCYADIRNSNFTSNNGREEGGAINVEYSFVYSNKTGLNINGSSFKLNTAGSLGGAINVEKDSEFKVNISSSIFSLNDAGDTGGAVYTEVPTSVKDSNFTYNRAYKVGGVYLGEFNSEFNVFDDTLYNFYGNSFINNDAVDMASDLYIEFQMDNLHYTFKHNFFKGNQTFVPAIYLKSANPKTITLNISDNSFVPTDALFNYVFIKVEDMQAINFNRNWWGKNNPAENSFFRIEVDGISSACLDSNPLFMHLEVPWQIQIFEEREMRIRVLIGAHGEGDHADHFPMGVDMSASSDDGEIRVGTSTMDPNGKSVFFTPRHNETALMTLKVDHETIQSYVFVNGSNPYPNWKKIMWSIGGVSIVVSALAIYKIFYYDDEDIPSNGTDCGDYVKFKSIADAINHAEDGCAIIISPGVYRGINSVGLNINKNIILMSDPNQTGDVIIDAEGKSWIWNISASNITILGLSFANGFADGDGGALKFNEPLENGTIISNFINNKAANGGAIYFASTGANVSYSEFTSNVARYDGGSIYFSNGGIIGNDTFNYNKANRGGAIFLIGDLNNQNISFNGNSANESANIYTVGTLDPDLGFKVNDVAEGEPVLMEITTDSRFSGIVFVEVNGSRYEVNVVNGYGNKTIDLGVGVYSATAIFTGTEQFKCSTISCEFEVFAKGFINPNLSVSARVVDSGRYVLIEINAISEYSGKVSVMLNSTPLMNYKVDVVDGYGSISISGLGAGKYAVVACCEAVGDFDASTASIDFDFGGSVHSVLNSSVSKVKTVVSAKSKAYVVNYGGKYGIVLKDAGGKVLSNRKVTFVLAGKSIGSVMTDSKGVATIKLTAKALKAAKVGKRNLKVRFAGDSNYAGISKTVKITISKEKTKVVAASKSFKSAVKAKKLVVYLKNSKNKAMKKKKVALRVNGRTYKAITNSKGKAIFKITHLIKKAKYTALVKYAGNKYYKPISKKVKIAVK